MARTSLRRERRPLFSAVGISQGRRVELGHKHAHLVAPGLWEIIKSSLQTSTD
jgi:hypothetical protein